MRRIYVCGTHESVRRPIYHHVGLVLCVSDSIKQTFALINEQGVIFVVLHEASILMRLILGPANVRRFHPERALIFHVFFNDCRRCMIRRVVIIDLMFA